MDWLEKIPTISINPDSATRDDIVRLATEFMELRGAVRQHERDIRDSIKELIRIADLILWAKVK